jgi:long-chain fatty acid transport protein
MVRGWVASHFSIRPDLALGFAYTFLDAGSAPVDQFRGPLAGRLVGDFGTNHVHIVNAHLTWRH